MANYTKLSINATEEQGEILAAYLAEFPFDSFDYADGKSERYAVRISPCSSVACMDNLV